MKSAESIRISFGFRLPFLCKVDLIDKIFLFFLRNAYRLLMQSMLFCWICGCGCEKYFYIKLSACKWTKKKTHLLFCKGPCLLCRCECVCSSPHYTHCVDLSSRVTPEAHSPALLRSKAQNYSTLWDWRSFSADMMKLGTGTPDRSIMYLYTMLYKYMIHDINTGWGEIHFQTPKKCILMWGKTHFQFT